MGTRIRADQVEPGQTVVSAGMTTCRHRPRVTGVKLVRPAPGRQPEVHLALDGPPGRLVLGRSEAVAVLDPVEVVDDQGQGR